MAKKKAARKTKPRTEAFLECLETVNKSGVTPRQWPTQDRGKKWTELTPEEQQVALEYCHPSAEYSSFKKVVDSGVIDPLFSALEDVYAEFPTVEKQHAEANSVPVDVYAYEGIQSVNGEKQYLNSVVSGLLSLMSEAIEKGNTHDAIRFAFEAGILWSMSGQTQERRFSSAVKSGMSRGRKLIQTESAEAGESIRNELRQMMIRNPSHSLTECRKALAKAKTHGCLKTIINHSKADSFPEGADRKLLKSEIKKT